MLFSARLREAANAVGTDLLLARKPQDWLQQARDRKPRLLILDLDTRSLDPVALISDTKADPALRDIPLVAYVSHVREDIIASARDAGADRVMARGAFAKNLQQILAG
jgi:CheY-like chemotaxis protein